MDRIRHIDWIRRGLRFECQPECGRCCTGAAREGTVFLERDDIERLADFLGLAPHAFVRAHTVDEDGEPVIAMSDSGDCRYLDAGQCTVYDARPLQCRTYPFLPGDGFTPVESSYTWRHEKKYCPGIGKGRLYRKSEIVSIMRGRMDVDGFEV
jgi:Fe-S-cluster containining protein